MNYIFEIERLSTQQRFMRVVYRTEGAPDIRKVFRISDFDQASVEAAIEARAEEVIAEWEAIAGLPDEDESSLGLTLSGAKAYTPPAEPAVTPASAIADVASQRWQKEGIGLFWTEPGTGDVYYLDTTVESQNRFAAGRLAASTGDRVDGSVWKCAKMVGGEPTLVFRPTTNAELTEWAGMVNAHVQKCFEAEADTVAAILGGDLNASFEIAFGNLP